MEWKNIYRGFMMGASDVVPGVSGGTIAVVLGIYDRLIAAINGFFSKEWRKHLGFLLPLGIGMAGAIKTLAGFMEWLLKHHPGPTFFLFLGLIIGVLPLLFHEADVKGTFKAKHFIILIIGAVCIGLLILLNDEEGAVIAQRSLAVYALLFCSGFLGSAAMILPGISGSFVLLVIGVYSTVISAINNLQLDVILVTGAGIFIGIVVMSKIINYFLTHHHTATFAGIIGMVIGSTVVIFPGWPANTQQLLISALTFTAGLAVAYIFGKVESKS